MSHRTLLKASLLFIVCLAQSLGVVDSDCVGAQAGAEEQSDDLAQNIYQHRNLGKAYFEEDQIEKAIAEFEACVALAPDSAAEWVNLAIAYLGAKRYEDAAKALDKAEALDATACAPHIYYNRALLYKRQTQFDKAAEQFEKVKELDPACADTRYNLGLTYLRLRQPEKAAVEFEKCVQLIPDHVSAHYHLYRNAVRTKQKALADAELETFLRLKGSIPESQRTDIALERSIYSEIIVPPPTEAGEAPPPSTGGTEGMPLAPPRGRGGFAAPLKDAVDANAISVKFIDVTEASGLSRVVLGVNPRTTQSAVDEIANFVFPASQYTKAFAEKHIVQQFTGAAAFLDFDNDGYLDIYVVRGSTIQADSTNRLYHNNGDGTFTDVTEKAGVGDAGMGLNCVIGDYDNDGYLDIYVANYGPNVLYHNNKDGTFTDVTNQAGVGNPGWSQDVLFVDYDHEGDLDIYVANYVDLTQTPIVQGETIRFPEDFVGSENVLYRNNGDGTFTDVTVSAGVGGGAQKSVKVFFSDFDDDNDIDLCVANVDSQSHLYLNLRDGKFGEFATAWGIQLRSESLRPDFQPLAVGDVNNDGRMDIVGAKIPPNPPLQRGAGGISPLSIATNQDNTHFDGFRPLPATDTNNVDAKHPPYPCAIDYDNDGRLDVLVVGRQYGLFRNNGDSGWTDVSREAFENLNLSDYRRAAFGDYDNDGDTDFLLVGSDGKLTLLRNEGGNANHWVRIQATGVKMNRAGLGSKVEAKAGTFYYKTEIATPHLLLGLGAHDRLDTIRIKWPNGIAQNEINVRANQTISITEKKGVPSSCPFVYVWDGDRYCFVKDILDVGALGVRMSENDYLSPDHDEVIEIDTVKPVPKDGVYSIRLTEELQELVYLDAVKLYVVDHPSHISVYHNDRFTLPPFPEFVFHAVKNRIYPVAAYDHHGNDITSLITARDRKYPKAFQPLPYTGLTETHAIILDFGALPKADKILLFLNGWINWGDSTTNVAVAQNSKVEPMLPYLQVRDREGQWQTVINPIGFPAGWGKTAAIDLTGKFLSVDHQIRIVTNMEIYWDEIFVGAEFHPESLTTTPLLPQTADLRFYGYATAYSPDGEGPLLYDYENVQLISPWNQPRFAGLTRYGDVTELLLDADDKYVIMSHGDEVHLEFNAEALPSLPKGWVRDYFLYADGWIKDGDVNTAFGATVEPLPFHGMSGYPYTAQESYPWDSEHLEYLRKYNTR